MYPYLNDIQVSQANAVILISNVLYFLIYNSHPMLLRDHV